MSRLRIVGAAALILAASALEVSAQIAETPEPIHVKWHARRPVRHLRPRRGAAGLSGLPRGVRGLPRRSPTSRSAISTDLGFSAEQVEALAAEYTVTDGPNDQGEMFERPARPADPIPPPYPESTQAARAANGGALPPELSLITKARAGGTDYVYSLLAGLRGAARRGAGARRPVLQRVLPGALDRDAAAAQ